MMNDEPTANWSDEERALLDQLRAGKTVVVSMRNRGHPNLVRWAERAGLFVRVDRGSQWRNPFKEGVDGTRDECCDRYEGWLMEQAALLEQIEELRGKALGCWCAPKRCHADTLVLFLDAVKDCGVVGDGRGDVFDVRPCPAGERGF